MDDQRTDGEGGERVRKTSPPHWFRFSLRTLLYVVAIAALVIAAYATGYVNGRLAEYFEYTAREINAQK